MIYLLVLCTLFVVFIKVIFDSIGLRGPVLPLFNLAVISIVQSWWLLGVPRNLSSPAKQLFFQAGFTISFMLFLAALARGRESLTIYLGTDDVPKYICGYYTQSFYVMVGLNFVYTLVGLDTFSILAGLAGVLMAKCAIYYFCHASRV